MFGVALVILFQGVVYTPAVSDTYMCAYNGVCKKRLYIINIWG